MSTAHMTAVLTGSSSVTVTHRGRNPAAEKKLRLDRRIAEVEKELADAQASRQAARTTVRNRARRALTAYNKAKTAREGAVKEIEGLKARIAELEASVPSLDAALVKAGGAHESARAAESALGESSPEVASISKTLEGVQTRLARHLAAHPEVKDVVLTVSTSAGPGDEDDETGDEDISARDNRRAA